MARPKKNKIDSIVSKLWFYTVEKESGLSAYALEKEYSPETFHPKDGEPPTRSGKWDKYRNLGTTPSDELIQKMRYRYPKTYEIFDLDLWKALRTPQTSQSELIHILDRTRPGIANQLRRIPTDLTVLQFDILFINRRSIKSLWMQGDLEALTALAALFNFAFISGVTLSPNTYAQKAFFHILVSILTEFPFSKIKEELFDYFTNDFMHMKNEKNVLCLQKDTSLEKYLQAHHGALETAKRLGIRLESTKLRNKFFYYVYNHPSLTTHQLSKFHFLPDDELKLHTANIRQFLAKDGRALNK